MVTPRNRWAITNFTPFRLNGLVRVIITTDKLVYGRLFVTFNSPAIVDYYEKVRGIATHHKQRFRIFDDTFYLQQEPTFSLTHTFDIEWPPGFEIWWFMRGALNIAFTIPTDSGQFHFKDPNTAAWHVILTGPGRTIGNPWSLYGALQQRCQPIQAAFGFTYNFIRVAISNEFTDDLIATLSIYDDFPEDPAKSLLATTTFPLPRFSDQLRYFYLPSPLTYTPGQTHSFVISAPSFPYGQRDIPYTFPPVLSQPPARSSNDGGLTWQIHQFAPNRSFFLALAFQPFPP